MVKKNKNLFWLNLPPSIMIGAAIIMVPIFVFGTIQNINKQKEWMITFLREKGAALIGSFEAGTRTGMMGMMGMPGGFKLQRLLTETAKQPDILYLIVTDAGGQIQAHNDPSQIGGFYGLDLDLEQIVRSDRMAWRRVSASDGSRVFEVYSRFMPSRIPGHPNRPRMFFGPRLHHPFPFPPDQQIIFIGLDMGPTEAIRQAGVRRSIIMGFIFLTIGAGGIFSLFLVQAYLSTQAALKRVQAFSDRLVRDMPIGLLATDADRKVAVFNQAAEKILQIAGSEVLGKRPGDVLPALFNDLLHSPATTPGPAVKEADFLLKSGQKIPLETTVFTLAEEEGGPSGHMVLFRDLSEIQDLKREVETTRRLAALGRLAAGVAHEIRNPLSSIKGFATFFKERYKQNQEDQNTAEIMIQEVDRLNRVITQLLEFARPTKIQKNPADLDRLVEHSLRMIAKEARTKGIEVRTDLTPVGQVALDADRINQMLLNLYLNALAAMEKGGIMSVVLRPDEDSGKVILTVGDTGSGIKKEELEHIFDPYFTTRASGTGLGLAIVHKIIEAHQGEIRVQSEPGKGSVFTVFLPNPHEGI